MSNIIDFWFELSSVYVCVNHKHPNTLTMADLKYTIFQD